MELHKLIEKAENFALEKDFSSQAVLEINLEILKYERNPGAITRLGRFYKETKDFRKSLEYYNSITKNDDLIYQNIAQKNILDIYKQIKEIEKEEKDRATILSLKNLDECFEFIYFKENQLNPDLQLNLIQKAKNLAKSEKDFLLLGIIYKRLGDFKNFNKIYLPIYEKSDDPAIVSLIRKFISPEQSENMCKRILEQDPNNIYIKNSLCASLADQEKSAGIKYLKECIKQHGIEHFELVIFHFLQIDHFFFYSPILEWIKNLKKNILLNYLETLEKNNVRKDKQDAIKEILFSSNKIN